MSAEIIFSIRAAHRARCFAMEQRKRADLSMGSFLRMQLGWRKDLPEAERKDIAARASAIMDDPTDSEWVDEVKASQESRAPWNAIEKNRVKQMEALARQLPVWSAFAEPIRGFGPASLAVIVAEAGDLSDYATDAKLWKRMGVAVLDGMRQGGLAKGANAEAWIEHGYNRRRRSRLWNIGDTLIKVNRDGKYRTAYLKRKKYELARDPEMAPIKAHRRAQRYMEKRLLRDLWRAWWRASHPVSERTRLYVPAAAAQGTNRAQGVETAGGPESNHENRKLSGQ